MVLSHTKGGGVPMRFFAPADDASGGSKSGASANGGGDGKGGDKADESLLDPKLFDSLPWNELDDETRSALNKIKEGAVATLQRAKLLGSEVSRIDKIARQNQSRADRLEADAKKRTKQKDDKGEGDGKGTVDDAYLNAVREELTGSGFPPEQAEQLAPVFANMFKKVGVIERERLGKDLQPMAAQVLATQAQDAFVTATQMDELGMFQTPEVQQQVWDLVRERVNQGVDTTPEIVLNLAKMAWVDKQLLDKKGGKAGGEGNGNEPARPMPSILPIQPPTMTTAGLFGAPSGQIRPIAQQTTDVNAPRHQLNDDTRNALAASFRTMLADTKIRPKELAAAIDKRR